MEIYRLLLGTVDGANIEIAEEVGEENGKLARKMKATPAHTRIIT